MTPTSLPVLEYLQRQLAGTLQPGDTTHVRYPTAISRLLGIEIIEVAERQAAVRIAADVELHGNQQGTIHGGLLCELADAAIGTAHSTIIEPGESFTSLDLDARFVRPAWSGTLIATARCSHAGRTISHYHCDIRRDDGKTIATVTSAVMTLRGEAAAGR
ncbi:PaaI family thioesterase [Nocardioides sp. BP30]|uniref:PaaI family thioesterase n=1 Tax=Nocardioides sp. BP30 TaxID=3036374 RepID=UPI0024687B9C|nr:PaaI family thioesterase [Nocardioides sp. BP30]WGL52417.1 PaaI family thioesterase [Nocardioides sp. BP30]